MKNYPFTAGARLKVLPLAISLLSLPTLVSNASAQALEEVLVTAERRVESLQDTPISITALNSEGIDKRGITNTDDMFASMPGMGGYSAPGSRGATSLSIRGISGGVGSNISLDPAVGMYVDGVYVGKMLGTAMDVAQIERIEILRGPQGTLYGRNSTAGAINVISRKPLGEFAADLTAGLGNYGLRTLKGSVDFDAIGEVGEGAGRLSAALNFLSKDRDGFYENYSGGEDFDNLDRLAWRAALRWEPRENITVDYIYDHSELDEVGTLQKAVGFTALNTQGTSRLDFLKNTVLPSAQGLAMAPGADGRIASRWIPSIQKTIDAYEQVLARGEGRPKGGWADNPPVSENESDGHAITAEWFLGERGVLGEVTLKSITAYREIETYVFGDLEDIDSSLDANGIGAYNDNLHLALLQIYGQFGGAGADGVWNAVDTLGAGHSLQDTSSAYEQFSQEFQLTGATAQLDYTLGLFWFEDESNYDRKAAFALPLAGRQAEKYTLNTDALALYGQGTYRFAQLEDRLALTIGMRYTEEKKAVAYNFGRVVSPFGVTPARSTDLDNNFYNFSYNATVAYDVADNINAFLRYATGYRSGGFNGEIFANGFDEETIEQVEVGVKSDWLDKRLRVNAGVYAYKYDDLQTSVIDTTSGTAASAIINAGVAERWGSELEISVAPVEAMVVSLAYSYIHGDFAEYPSTCFNGECIKGYKESKRGNSPSNKVNLSLDYTFASTAIGDFNLFVDANWQDTWEQVSLAPAVISDGMGGQGVYSFPVRSMDERTVVNARISLSNIPVEKGELMVSLWGNNLTDDDYPAYGINFQGLGLETEQYGAPRTYGLELRYRY
ncbi:MULTISPECIES: TonB-dependent receptor [Spongiibacter]|uniref:TonB-dependent receptor n=1 Tax=Spongiibacter TaxID=630749 RepID=UPI000C6A281F|nr:MULTISPECIES: TonB-dependent receptor [Spongiibacter]MAY39742.1 TonB-dependent receptor [Spongiibacter sp.]|tara:strand:- start:1169 stop:3688 length:2520 start_codon:yes stop_codon:yes gene_type:complete